ncbi:MAG: GTPase domain-containing protein [Acidobacteriota bacterium]
MTTPEGPTGIGPTEPAVNGGAPGGEGARVALSLVSHTNVGKTTLARTLMRRDVGEVLDQAHVTEVAEDLELIRADGERLVLWDTPGFGDSARLLRRLRTSEKPVLWFLQQTWDRFTDRAFWCSQQAALNIRHEADAVLYLVNATEEPEEAGYVAFELELLGWIGVPVLVLLNQTGDLSFRGDLAAEAEERWRRHTERFGVVGAVQSLDAFSRCWVQESHLLERVEGLLGEPRKSRLGRLRRAWDARNLAVFDRCVEAMAGYLERAARDREVLPSKRPGREDKRLAMEALGTRLVGATEALMTKLLAAHGLEGDAAAEIDRQLDAFAVQGEDALDPERSALFGSIVSGAVGGLAADILAGGLTFGGGVLAGAILGALGGAGLARGYQLVKGDRLPEVGWASPFMVQLTEQVLLRYLAVAHFGRGRGEFRNEGVPQRWRDAVGAELRRTREPWGEAWKGLTGPRPPAEVPELRRLVDGAARGVLAAGYPEAATLLGQGDPSARPASAAAPLPDDGLKD